MKVKTVRVFKTKNEDGEELIYEFRRPSQAVMAKAELIRKAKFSEALRAGVVINAEVFKILRERGLWGDDEEAESKRLREEISNLEEKLKSEQLSNDDGINIVAGIRTNRLLLEAHQSIATQIADATCESIASETVNMFYASSCIYNKNEGQKVYKDLEDFRGRLNDPSTIDCYREATIASLEVLIGQDLPSDLSTQYTENKWLAERGLDKVEAEADEDKDEASEPDEPEEPDEVGVEKPRKKRAKKTAVS